MPEAMWLTLSICSDDVRPPDRICVQGGTARIQMGERSSRVMTTVWLDQVKHVFQARGAELLAALALPLFHAQAAGCGSIYGEQAARAVSSPMRLVVVVVFNPCSDRSTELSRRPAGTSPGGDQVSECSRKSLTYRRPAGCEQV